MSDPWKPLSADELAIAHISDLHFGSPGAESVWGHVHDFLTGTLRPEFLLVSGDLVHTPEPRLYGDAKRALDAVGVPYFVCSGNHDRHGWATALPANSFAATGGCAADFGSSAGGRSSWAACSRRPFSCGPGLSA